MAENGPASHVSTNSSKSGGAAAPSAAAAACSVAEIRLLAARQLVASIAHEISQPLSSIVNFSRACVNLLQEQSPNLQLLREWNEEMGLASMRAAELVLRMRRLLGGAHAGRQRVRAHVVIAEAIVSAAPEQRSCPIQVQCQLGPQNPLIEIDRVQILQVLDYLLRITCESIERQHNASRQLVVSMNVVGERGEIVVAGGKVGEEMSQPASASDDRRGGSGCLAVCKMIVEAHGGTLCIADLRNDVAFLLNLPLVFASGDAVEPQ